MKYKGAGGGSKGTTKGGYDSQESLRNFVLTAVRFILQVPFV